MAFGPDSRNPRYGETAKVSTTFSLFKEDTVAPAAVRQRRQKWQIVMVPENRQYRTARKERLPHIRGSLPGITPVADAK